MLGALSTAVRALDRTTYFVAEYERLFQKIYLSVLFGSPQSIPSTDVTCTKIISPEMGLYRSEKNRAILNRLPVGRIDEDFAMALRSYMFWPIRCSPVSVEDISVSLYGLGTPYYLRVEFLPTARCSKFIGAIKSAIISRSLSSYMIDDQNYDAASKYYEPSILVTEYIMRKNQALQNELIEDALGQLGALKISYSCERGSLELRQ